MPSILDSFEQRAHPRADVVDRSIPGRNDERLVDMRPDPPPAELDLGHDVVYGADHVAVDRVLRWRCRGDDPELRAAVEAAPQVISRKAGLDPHLDANA